MAQKLGWERPVPLFATAIHHRTLRIGPNGRRPGPNGPQWPETVARVTALACQTTQSLYADMSRRPEKLLQVAPKLPSGAVRVIDMLLLDDCITPARRKASGLCDRTARRLFDRLIELGAVRELSGHANFRLYGL